MGSDKMFILIFSFTLFIAFNIYKLTGREQYMTREKPIWKKLIYWGSILFISIIFNVIMYSGNKDTYRLSSYINNDNLELIILLILCCLSIQLLSPTLFGMKLAGDVKAFIRKLAYKKSPEKDMAEDKNINYSELSPGKKSNIFSAEKAKPQPGNLKDLQEKDFELFLNSLCWLAFTFVFFIILFSVIITYGANNNVLDISASESSTAREQLNYIASVMLIFTLPIAIRQILFYLSRLRHSTDVIDKNLELNSMRYQKYMLIQKRLVKSNKRL